MAGGINSRYMAISDRIRSLTHEYREKETTVERRRTICSQMPIFLRRVNLVSWSIRFCYTAMACFVLMALVITATALRLTLVAVTVPMFLIGIIFLITAIVLQLLELRASNRTIVIEVKDILN
jgi:hypothetical protein